MKTLRDKKQKDETNQKIKSLNIQLSDQESVSSISKNQKQTITLTTKTMTLIEEKQWPKADSIEAALSFAMEFGVQKRPDLSQCYQVSYYERLANGQQVESNEKAFETLFSELPESIQQTVKAHQDALAPAYVA